MGNILRYIQRAAGLAEGYKADDALNAEKFYMNFFVDNQIWTEADKKLSKNEAWRQYYKGPRDRLYRTGDLGRYLDESGDVECTGRADDQVKIRGFRIVSNLRGIFLLSVGSRVKTLVFRGSVDVLEYSLLETPAETVSPLIESVSLPLKMSR